MSHQSAPEVIYIIRHGEKPPDRPPKHPAAHSGVDFRGHQNEHSLLPRGWQRSGALAALFDPTHGPRRVGAPLRSPFAGHWRARRGEYRVRYTIDDDAKTVTVLDIDHRRDAYHRATAS